MLLEPIIIKTNISLNYLNFIKYQIESAKEFHFLYGGPSFEEKFPKIELLGSLSSNSREINFLRGLISPILFQIYEQGGNKYFNLDLIYCGVSIKDKHKKDNIHTDHTLEQDSNLIKVLGIINSDWDPQWGGGFMWNNKTYSIGVNEFLIFDPKIPHAAADILCDQKRVAIDFTVPVKM